MRSIFKIAGYVFLTVFILLLALYFYVTQNAERVIKSFVEKQSHGRFSINMKKVSLDIRHLHLAVIEPSFTTNDTTHLPTTYDVKADRLILELNALRPLVFENKIIVDTFSVMRPQITATKRKDLPHENFSLPEQMGKVYNTLTNLLNTLNIKYCLVDSGTFTLVNKVEKDRQPVSITDYYLRIDNFTKDELSDVQNRYLFTDRIKFYSSHQDIVSPDGNHGIKYGRLRINSFKQSIEIDSCYIYGRKPNSGFNEFGVFFDTLRLTHVDFNKLSKSRMISADSAICMNPVINLRTESAGASKAKSYEVRIQAKDTMEMVVKALFGDIGLHYLGVTNASLMLQTKSNGRINSYSTHKNDFIIREITIVKDPAVPLTIGSMYMGLKDYRAYDPDSNYAVSFDSIILQDRKLELSNFAITPTGKNTNRLERRDIRMQSLNVEGLDWMELLFNRKLAARDVVMVRPQIELITPGKTEGRKKQPRKLLEVIHEWRNRIAFRHLQVRDADVNVYTGSKTHIALEKVNAGVEFNQLLQANNFNELTGSMENISFRSGTITTGTHTIYLQNGMLNRKKGILTASEAAFADRQGKLSAEMGDIRVERGSKVDPEQLTLAGLSWNKARLLIQRSGREPNQSAAGRAIKRPGLSIEKLNGKNTSVTIRSGKLDANLYLDSISTETINWTGGGPPNIQGLQVFGKSLSIENPSVRLRAQAFDIHDGDVSHFRNLSLYKTGKKNSLSLTCPDIAFTPNVNEMASGHPRLSDVVIQSPQISFAPAGDPAKMTGNDPGGNLPTLYLNQLSIINPVINPLPDANMRGLNIAEQRSGWVFRNINLENNRAAIGNISSSVTGISADLKKISIIVKDPGRLDFELSDISYAPGRHQTPAIWSATLLNLSARDVVLDPKKNDTVSARVNLYSMKAMNLGIKSGEKLQIRELLANNASFRISDGHFSMENRKSLIHLSGLDYDQTGGRLQFDSLSYRPSADRDSFMKSSTWQTDYMELQTRKTVFSGINPEQFFKDSLIAAKKIEMAGPVLHVYKDKRLPFDFSKTKPLPTALLQKMSRKIRVDSLRLENADITYEEFNENTLKTGEVHLRRTQVLMENIRNFNLSPSDSLRLSATSWFMDTAYLRMKFSESYLDTLHGFTLAVRVRPFDMTALNPVLGPLLSAKISRGWLDTLRMNAIGREYIAYGKMKMYYHGLKARYLSKGDEKTKTLKTRLVTFAANDLILRHKNTRGHGKVYAERTRSRSIFNYWLKMLISGMMSSTGVKSNKKQDRKYNHSIQRLKVPEIPEVEL